MKLDNMYSGDVSVGPRWHPWESSQTLSYALKQRV